MTLFLIALAVLIAGYFTYGFVVERIFGVEPSRPTPATHASDGIDFVPLPTWKVFMIQFLNIAGVGPIFGAIMGIMYGPAAFLWIALGTIFAGAVHDFVSAMLSVRSGGKSLPEIVGDQLGRRVKAVMGFFTVFLLIMVVAVFVRTPASLLAPLVPDISFNMWVLIIFAYYIIATLLPIDKVIGNLYPLFGFALLFMAVGIMAYLLFGPVSIPVSIADFTSEGQSWTSGPVFPMMFVSIACGAISGFHATQSPMMARCLKNERYARPVFYGAMVAEGVVALIWAAAAVTFTGGYVALTTSLAEHNNDAGWLVSQICNSWLGIVGGVLAVLGVIAAPITTGDTAMRSCRLILADAFSIDQKNLVKRILIALPIIGACFFLMEIDFTVLWRYFAWSNQTLSVFTLWTCTVWLASRGKNFYITLLPALLMTVVCTTYICFAPTGKAAPDLPGLSLKVSTTVGGVAAILCLLAFMRYRRNEKALNLIEN